VQEIKEIKLKEEAAGVSLARGLNPAFADI